MKYGKVSFTRSHSNLQPRCDTIRPMTEPRDSLSTSSEVTSGTSDPLSNERIQDLTPHGDLASHRAIANGVGRNSPRTHTRSRDHQRVPGGIGDRRSRHRISAPPHGAGTAGLNPHIPASPDMRAGPHGHPSKPQHVNRLPVDLPIRD